eukprot:6207404-Pleurochrysis_carterae.AAC.2
MRVGRWVGSHARARGGGGEREGKESRQIGDWVELVAAAALERDETPRRCALQRGANRVRALAGAQTRAGLACSWARRPEASPARRASTEPFTMQKRTRKQAHGKHGRSGACTQ